MTGRISCNSRTIIVILLMLFGFSRTALPFQKTLSGNINQPQSHVVTFTPGSDRVTVDNVAGFAAGDTILLIQMQGVRILTDPQGSYGTLQNKFGEPGMHEFLIILSVNTGSKEIVFRNNVLNNFDAKGNLQIVRVPYYNSAVVTGVLTCNPWDPVTKSGGVIAMIIGRTLKLNANIDVSGQGFKGGKDTIGSGICWNTNTILYGKEYYSQSFTNAGYKGEGVAIHNDAGSLLIPFAAKGLGPNFTGGGGGNGRYSGGGGGSNRGTGGVGGQEDCFPASPGGNGGFIADHPSLTNRIYFGGGGGASTSSPSTSSSYGGAGGGIVIIIADTIIGNGGNIISKGNSGGSVTGVGGSGGGGAGGSIVLSVNSYGSAPLSFLVNGGKGGDNPGSFGEGGGGGGGLLWISKNTSANVTVALSGGNSGNYPGSSAASGTAGDKRTSPLFKPNLNGFLFNSIRSSVSNDQVDSICSNMLPKKITGTIPVGGTTPYTYLWEKSYDQVSWTALPNDPDPTNYTPSVIETSTVYFRRTITDNSTVPLVDISKTVKIIVQPFIKNNIIGYSDTICYNLDRPLIQQLLPDLTDGNNKSYYFKWQDSTATASWGSSIAATKNLASQPLIKTSWYRRTVTSGRCIDSTAKVKITVLPKITSNNILSAPQDICFGMVFNNLSATKPPVLSGGDNVYLYKWQANINGGGWGNAPGKIDTAGYNPPEYAQRIPSNTYVYRRIVYSGIHDACHDTSATVLLRDYPVLSNNTITANQTIGHDSVPATFIGSLPIYGNASYNYLWQYKTKIVTWSSAPGVNNQQNYSAAALTDTTWYRRVVTSSACSDTSNIIVVNVHKTIVSNTIAFAQGSVEDTICNGAVPAILKGTLPTGGTNIPGDYSFKWYYSTNNTTWTAVATGGTSQDYQPPSLTTTTWFRRYVSSPASSPSSTSKSNSIKITVLPLISNYDIKKDTIICYNTQPAVLQGFTLSGGDGTYRFTWQDSTSASGWTTIAGVITSTYQPPVLTSKGSYKRFVYSGIQDACSAISNVVKIGINALPTGSITPLTDTICEGSAVNLTINLTGKSPWTVKYNENSTQVTYSTGSTVSTTTRTPAVTGASANYSYALTSVQDGNSCFATSLTAGVRKSTVYKVPKSNAGNDTTICGPKITLKAIPSYGSGKWYENSLLLGSTPTLTYTIDSLFSGGYIYHTFRWQEANWLCMDKDSLKVKFDKRIQSAYAGPEDTTLYTFDKIYHMVAGSSASWERGKWTLIAGSGIFENDTLNKTKVTDLSDGKNSYQWKVSNGTCSFSDVTNVTVMNIVIPMGFSPNNVSGNQNNTFKIRGLDKANQIAKLSIVNGAGTEVFSTINDPGQGLELKDWDGKNASGADQPEGTYYYLLTITGESGQVQKWSGFLILKRYSFH